MLRRISSNSIRNFRIRSLSVQKSPGEGNALVAKYMQNWPGPYRIPINKLIEELQRDQKITGIVRDSHIDHHSWMTFTASMRRKIVKSPVMTMGGVDGFLKFHALLQDVTASNEEKSKQYTANMFDKLRKQKDGEEHPPPPPPPDPSSSSPSSSSESPASESSTLSFSPSSSYEEAHEALKDHVFQKLFRRAKTELKDTIISYRALSTISDLRNPNEWYPYARLMKRKIIYHGGPTNSGKTYHALKRLQEADPTQGGGLYCGPLRLLALEVYDSLNKAGIVTNLRTGQERRETPFATHVSSTLEMVGAMQREFDVAVIDEIQMISHEQRGSAWTKALQGLRAREIHVCGGLEALNIVRNLVEDMGDEFELVEYERLSKLEIDDESLQGDYSRIRPGDCVVAFSRAEIFSIRREIERLTPYKCCMVYGQLPPETRSTQARLFNEENTGFDVLVASDAIGMGLNLNIGRIIFHTTLKKGRNPREATFLDPTTVKQIAGRAGRLSSKYEVGHVTAWQSADLAYIKGVMEWEIPQLQEAGLFPSVEQVEAFSEKLKLVATSNNSSPSRRSKEKGDVELSTEREQTIVTHSESTKISALMARFVELARIDGRYFMCEHEDLVTVANWLHSIPLTLEDRFLFANAPVNTNSALGMNLLYHFASGYAQSRPVSTNVRIPKNIPTDVKQFIDLCAKHNVLDLYLWLSNRFPKYFVARDTCLEQKRQAITLIEKCLHKSALTQQFSHSAEYQSTRERLNGDYLPPEDNPQVRESTQKFLDKMDPDSLVCFPHADDELEAASGATGGGGRGGGRGVGGARDRKGRGSGGSSSSRGDRGGAMKKTQRGRGDRGISNRETEDTKNKKHHKQRKGRSSNHTPYPPPKGRSVLETDDEDVTTVMLESEK